MDTAFRELPAKKQQMDDNPDKASKQEQSRADTSPVPHSRSFSQSPATARRRITFAESTDYAK